MQQHTAFESELQDWSPSEEEKTNWYVPPQTKCTFIVFIGLFEAL